MCMKVICLSGFDMHCIIDYILAMAEGHYNNHEEEEGLSPGWTHWYLCVFFLFLDGSNGFKNIRLIRLHCFQLSDGQDTTCTCGHVLSSLLPASMSYHMSLYLDVFIHINIMNCRIGHSTVFALVSIQMLAESRYAPLQQSLLHWHHHNAGHKRRELTHGHQRSKQ